MELGNMDFLSTRAIRLLALVSVLPAHDTVPWAVSQPPTHRLCLDHVHHGRGSALFSLEGIK